MYLTYVLKKAAFDELRNHWNYPYLHIPLLSKVIRMNGHVLYCQTQFYRKPS